MAASSAKVAIQAFCQALKLIGLPDLPPESVRQAKFAQGSTQQLWRVLHDAVLLSMLKGEEACQSSQQLQPSTAISKLWVDIAEERLLDIDIDQTDTAGIGQEGQDMICLQLSEWGCCPQLVEQLTSSSLTTRHLLLALVWVVAHRGLLLDAIQRLSIPLHTMMALPPYAMDARGSPAVQSTCAAAAKTATEHCQAVQAHIKALQQQAHDALTSQSRRAQGTTRTGLQPTMAKQRQLQSSGVDVSQSSEEAAQKMWRAVDAAANLTASLLGKTRAALLSLQSMMDAVARLNCEVQDMQAGIWPTSPPLSAAELALLQQPPEALQQLTGKINAAVAALQEQHQLVKGCQLFFLWAASAVEEEARSRPNATGLQDNHYSAMAGMDSSGALATLAALPPAGSPASEALLGRLQQQVTEAVQKAQRCSSPYIAHNTSQTLNMPSVQQFKLLARAALSGQQGSTFTKSNNATSQNDTGSVSHKLSSIDQAFISTSWDLPPDIVTALTSLQQSQSQASDIERQWVTQQALQRLGSALAYTCQSHSKPSHRNQQQQQQQQHACSAPNGGSMVQDASSETDRLLGLTLSIAKLLAQVRGCHRQAIQNTASQLSNQFTMQGIP